MQPQDSRTLELSSSVQDLSSPLISPDVDNAISELILACRLERFRLVESLDTQADMSIVPSPKLAGGTTSRRSKRRSTPPSTKRGPRAPNGFFLFRSDFLKKSIIPQSIENRQQSLSRVIGQIWRMLPEEDRELWKKRAHESAEKRDSTQLSYKSARAERRRFAKGRLNPELAEKKALDYTRMLRESFTNFKGDIAPPSNRDTFGRRRKTSKDLSCSDISSDWSPIPPSELLNIGDSHPLPDEQSGSRVVPEKLDNEQNMASPLIHFDAAVLPLISLWYVFQWQTMGFDVAAFDSLDWPSFSCDSCPLVDNAQNGIKPPSTESLLIFPSSHVPSGPDTSHVNNAWPDMESLSPELSGQFEAANETTDIDFPEYFGTMGGTLDFNIPQPLDVVQKSFEFDLPGPTDFVPGTSNFTFPSPTEILQCSPGSYLTEAMGSGTHHDIVGHHETESRNVDDHWPFSSFHGAF